MGVNMMSNPSYVIYPFVNFYYQLNLFEKDNLQVLKKTVIHVYMFTIEYLFSLHNISYYYYHYYMLINIYTIICCYLINNNLSYNYMLMLYINILYILCYYHHLDYKFYCIIFTAVGTFTEN